MSDYDNDPKKPHPIEPSHKGDNAMESQEHEPRAVLPLRKRGDRDQQLPVRC